MGEVTTAFLRFEAVQQRPDLSPRRLNGTFGRVAEQGFEFGEDLFNRVEIGGVEREEAERGPTRSMAARTAGLLWLLRLSRMTISPGVSVGSRHCST